MGSLYSTGIKKRKKEKCISYTETFTSKLKKGSALNLYVNTVTAQIIEQAVQRVSSQFSPFYSIINVLFFQIQASEEVGEN